MKKEVEMKVERVKNTRYWYVRAKHHAKELLPLIPVVKDIVFKAHAIKVFKTRLRICTENGSYILKPWFIEGKGYVGIAIYKYGDKQKHLFLYIK